MTDLESAIPRFAEVDYLPSHVAVFLHIFMSAMMIPTPAVTCHAKENLMKFSSAVGLHSMAGGADGARRSAEPLGVLVELTGSSRRPRKGQEPC